MITGNPQPKHNHPTNHRDDDEKSVIFYLFYFGARIISFLFIEAPVYGIGIVGLFLALILMEGGFIGTVLGAAVLAGTVWLISKIWPWQQRTRQQNKTELAIYNAMDHAGVTPASIDVQEKGNGSYTVTIGVPPGFTRDDVERTLAAVADELRLFAFSIEPGTIAGGKVVVTMSTQDVWAEAIPAPDPSDDASITEPISVGVDAAGQVLHMPLVGNHTLIGGTTGGGKSQGLLRIIESGLAAPDAQVWGIDPARVEFALLKDRLNRVALTQEDAADLLSEAVSEMNRRLQIMEDRGITKWKPSSKDPAIILVVDELATLTNGITDKKLKKQVDDDLADLARVARKTAISLVLATQTPDTTVVTSQIRNNMTNRWCFRVSTTEQAKTILGGTMPDSIDLKALHPDRPGMAFFSTPKYQPPVLGRAYLVNE